MSNVLEQPVRNVRQSLTPKHGRYIDFSPQEQPPAQPAASSWSLQNNSTERSTNSANSSVTSIDSFTASQHRAAAAVREKYTGSGQQAPPPPQDLAYVVTYTRPIEAPEPITPCPLLQGMHVERPAPARLPTLGIQGSVSTIDLDTHDTNVHGFTGVNSASSEGSCSPENSCIVQVASHSENNGEANAGKRTHDSAQDPKKKYSLETNTEGNIPNNGPTSRPPKPKPTIANYVRRISRNLMPKKGALKQVLSRWLPRRRDQREKTCEPVVTSNDAGGGKMKRR